MHTDHEIETRRLDIVVLDKEMGHMWVRDISVLDDGRVTRKGKAGIIPDHLAKEISKLWQTSVTVVPIVVGTLRTVVNLEGELSKFDVGRKSTEHRCLDESFAHLRPGHTSQFTLSYCETSFQLWLNSLIM